MSFRALLAEQDGDGIRARVREVEDDLLMPGDVDIDVAASTINYKDGLAITGRAPVLQSFPLIPGIDLAGTVTASRHDGFAPGDRVVLNGYGLGERHHGGLAEKARVPGDWLVPLPDGISERDAAAIGTAGYTAMLCVLALEHGGAAPDRGDVLVTGAAGGVGSVAVAILAGLGYRVIASTGRAEEAAYLEALGAAELLDRTELSEAGGRPIASERWAAVVDCVGSHTLANALARTRYDGVVAACGLAQGADLPGSVLPFILRGVTLAGVDSVMAPMARRRTAWERLDRDLDRGKLASTTREIGLDAVPQVAADILEGKVRGRTVVDVHA
jgi:acrylyl-CoA reductase (NADPH)